MSEHKEILKQIAKDKAAYAKKHEKAVALAEDCIANIKRLEECEKLLNNGTEASVTGIKIA